MQKVIPKLQGRVSQSREKGINIMEKIKVIIKYDLFKAIGLTVEKCSAYTEDSDSYVRINGEIVCNEKWDEDYCLKVKANLCNEDDDVVHIDYDYDVKRFIKLGYETFSISCYKGNVKSIKCVEIYPKLIMTSEREDD
jgi:hypothetical protein